MDERQQRVRLAEAMATWRKRRGLSVRAAAQAAGIDRNTWATAETAQRRLAEYNYANVERALGWAPGSVDNILAGGEPTEQTRLDVPSAGERDEEIEMVVSDPSLDAAMKAKIIELILQRRERERAASLEETRRMIDLFKSRSA